MVIPSVLLYAHAITLMAAARSIGSNNARIERDTIWLAGNVAATSSQIAAMETYVRANG